MTRETDDDSGATDGDAPGAEAMLAMLRPLAGIALTLGLKLPELVELTKIALTDAARAGPAAARSDSRIAVMTGVHRKDLRRLRERGERLLLRRRSIAAETFSRWLSDPRFLTHRARPRVLPRTRPDEAGRSFDGLVGSISRDVHPRGVLDELQRLGLAALDGRDRVRLTATAFVPGRDRDALLRFAAANVADHLHAADGNLRDGPNQFLEQAIYADELSERSALEFNAATRQAWEAMFAQMMPRLRRLFERDRHESLEMTHRVRLGMYGVVARRDPAALETADDAPKPPVPKRGRR